MRGEAMMDIETLFSKALGIESPWIIKGINFDSVKKRLEINVDFVRGATFKHTDESTGEVKEYKAYDTKTKTWRHLNFFEHECYLVVRTPRIKPEGGGIQMIMPPWSGVVAGFTMLFEALILQLCIHTPVHQVGKILKIWDRKLWHVLDCYVFKGLLQADHSEIKAFGVDETSVKKGHDYISLFVDLNHKKTIHISEGKDHQTVLDFAETFEQNKGIKEKILDVSCDMSPAFIKGIKQAFPAAKITFDKFHILKKMNEAVDSVRRSEVKTEDCLKGARFTILKNEKNLTAKQKEIREKLSKMNLKTTRAIRIREGFQEIYNKPTYEDFEKGLKEWYFWATHSRLEPIKKVARTIKNHWDGILRWKESQINNGILEGLNSVIQAAKRKARGYGVSHFKTMAFLLTGKFDFKDINPFLPTPFA
jgi:transposase